MAGKFELYKDNAGEFRFRLKAGNGEVVGSSEGYKAKASAENGIESVMKNASDDSRYDFKEGKNGKWYFNLKASNGPTTRPDAFRFLKRRSPKSDPRGSVPFDYISIAWITSTVPPSSIIGQPLAISSAASISGASIRL